VLGWIGSGKLQLRIEKTYPLADAAQAHRDLEGRGTAGKLLLIPKMPTREEERRARAGALIGENKLDALLVTNLVNVRYLTGFTGSNGQLLVLRDGSARLMTDPATTSRRASR